MIILKHHTIVSLIPTHQIKSKVGQKINCRGRKILSLSEICSGVHLDACNKITQKIWSGLATNACVFPYQWSCLVTWWKYCHMCWSHWSWLHSPLYCSGHCKQCWLDGKNWKNNKNNVMTTDMCLSICFIMKYNSFTFHLIQWMQCQ